VHPKQTCPHRSNVLPWRPVPGKRCCATRVTGCPGATARKLLMPSRVKANLHREVAMSSHARFLVLLRPGVAVSIQGLLNVFQEALVELCTSAGLPNATKQTKDYAWQFLARPQCRLAFKSSRPSTRTAERRGLIERFTKAFPTSHPNVVENSNNARATLSERRIGQPRVFLLRDTPGQNEM